MMKKGILFRTGALAVVLLAAVSSFAGCGKKEEATTSGVEKVTIWTADSHSKNDMLELVDKFNDNEGKQLGVEIEYVVKEGDISKTIEMAIASNQEPDMYKTWSTQKYYESGDIMAIEDIEGGRELLDSYPEEMISRFRNKKYNKTFTVPYYANTFGIAYNADMFKKAGIVDKQGNAKPPETYEELRECAKKLTDEKSGEFGIIIPLKDASFYQNVGKLTFASKGTSGYNYSTGEYEYEKLEPALDILLKIKNDGSIYPGADGLDNDTARALFAEGKIGMIFTGSYDAAVFTKQFPAKCSWDVAPMPVEDKSNRYLQKMSADGGLVINKEMYKKLGAQKTLAVYKWFHGEEMLAELYKRGCCIPENPEVFKDIKPNNEVPPVWENYGKLINISYVERGYMPTDLQGTPDFKTLFQTKLWVEQGDALSLLKDLTKRSNDGIKIKEEQSEDFKRSDYIITDYNVKR